MLPTKPQFQTKKILDDLRLKATVGPLTFHKQTAGPQICTAPQESFYPTPTSDVVLEENEQGKIPQRLKPGPLREMGAVVLPKEQNENSGTTPVLGPGSLNAWRCQREINI